MANVHSTKWFPKLSGCRVMGWSSSPSAVCQSLGSVKPSVLTPPSPNEVTVCFQSQVAFRCLRLLLTQEVGCSPPPAEYQVRGRIQVVFLWWASIPFGSQLSTLTGPGSEGRLGMMSSTSPREIFSHWHRFSLQTHSASVRVTVCATAANISLSQTASKLQSIKSCSSLKIEIYLMAQLNKEASILYKHIE